MLAVILASQILQFESFWQFVGENGRKATEARIPGGNKGNGGNRG